MAKSLKQLYDQWDRVFMYFACVDYDMAKKGYNTPHERIIEYACNALVLYDKNIVRYFGKRYSLSDVQYCIPVEREIYQKAR